MNYKFRVWDKLLNKWGNPADFLGIDVWGNLICENSLNPRNSVVQLCNGQKDKNGKLIFEGDILELEQDEGIDEFPNYVKYVEEVKLMDGMLVGPLDIPISAFYSKQMKILGNIFENPELLNKNEV